MKKFIICTILTGFSTSAFSETSKCNFDKTDKIIKRIEKAKSYSALAPPPTVYSINGLEIFGYPQIHSDRSSNFFAVDFKSENLLFMDTSEHGYSGLLDDCKKVYDVLDKQIHKIDKEIESKKNQERNDILKDL